MMNEKRFESTVKVLENIKKGEWFTQEDLNKEAEKLEIKKSYFPYCLEYNPELSKKLKEHDFVIETRWVKDCDNKYKIERYSTTEILEELNSWRDELEEGEEWGYDEKGFFFKKLVSYACYHTEFKIK